MEFLKMFLSKERLIKIAGAIAFAAAGAAIGMKSAEVKQAVCEAPAIEAQKIEAPKK